MMPTRIALDSHFELFIRQQVESGRYNNATEVVHAGLRLLEEQERRNNVKQNELQQSIAIGMQSGDEKDAGDVFGRLQAKYKNQL
ncbi:type II toxin-antitoxin system ParD family antitoxin [Advenella mimigardefordensis]|uniref:Putative addiction module antidote protein, CC2985 family n=1 Tax=Advenella mimigardefordensis (strain DSM 17166 / LMG 22922 / DPN7) TaxID=1247726 RepID=W0PFX4_ADVMD|nr:type II toxin-antitoxin system ParD family antitoxin [Advenella mimigardefordensis]AHG65591.1 putative addiction module antidote protein, CC2985 family [Advenella mimigardefordensis DPN7]